MTQSLLPRSRESGKDNTDFIRHARACRGQPAPLIDRLDVGLLGEFKGRGHVVGEEFAELLDAHLRRLDAELGELLLHGGILHRFKRRVM